MTEGLGHYRKGQEDYRGYMNGQYEDHARYAPDAAGVTKHVHRLGGSRAAILGQP
jgi:hypothetical protein